MVALAGSDTGENVVVVVMVVVEEAEEFDRALRTVGESGPFVLDCLVVTTGAFGAGTRLSPLQGISSAEAFCKAAGPGNSFGATVSSSALLKVAVFFKPAEGRGERLTLVLVDGLRNALGRLRRGILFRHLILQHTEKASCQYQGSWTLQKVLVRHGKRGVAYRM